MRGLAEKIAGLKLALEQITREIPYTGRNLGALRRACSRRDKIAARLKAAEDKAANAATKG